ncbi:MAG: hypothetical protein J3Q66DRAFT_395877 [Benniella sp.]|nr:MAG: hypothetical protein J3Q66DRAFT_395877 [Benniella sp.]
MSAFATILDIPHLLDTICAGLWTYEISTCAACCKAWYSAFGPYRFRKLEIKYMDHDRLSFLYQVGHLVHDLWIQMPVLEVFDSSRCTSLRKLYLSFKDGDNDDKMEAAGPEHRIATTRNQSNKAQDGWERTPTLAKFDRFARMTDLIRQNQRLRSLWLLSSFGAMCSKSLDQPILDAIRSLPALTIITIQLDMTCLVLAKLINHLPPQLQELNIYGSVTLATLLDHDLCKVESRLFKSHDSPLSLRSLVFLDVACFTKLSFIHLLKRCPDLEHLDLPHVSNDGEDQNYLTEVAHLLDSGCKRLSSLGMRCLCPECHPGKDASMILQKFSRGFKCLRLSAFYCEHDSPPTWATTIVLETLIFSPTVNTIEDLTFSSDYGNGDRFIRILEQCPRLRVFRAKHTSSMCRGLNASDLLSSMEKPWKCQDTLETLELNVYDSVQKMEQLRLRLRSLPRLTWFSLR